MVATKSHAHLWYPKDIITDKRVIAMTLVEEAVYRRLLDFAWIENGLDNDMALLAYYAKLNGQPSHFLEVWKIVKKCFFLRRGKWRNKRQEKERKKQKLYSDKQRNAAKHRWDKDKEHHATALPRHTSGNASSQDQSSQVKISKESNQSKIQPTAPHFKKLTDDQLGKLMEEIHKVKGFSPFSQAGRVALKELLDRVYKAKGVRNIFAYAMKAVKNLNEVTV